MKLLLLLIFGFCASPLCAQQIGYITPDAAAPGMTVCVEVIGMQPGSFGVDGFNRASIVLTNTNDTASVLVGPAITSWGGRLVNVMFFIKRGAGLKTVRFRVKASDGSLSSEESLSIVTPQSVGTLTNGGVLGAGGKYGTPSVRNTLVVDSLVLSNGVFFVSKADVDPGRPGNQSFLPLTILSQGPIRIKSELTLSALGKFSVAGGGGGGGAAFTQGGDGYTGGGGTGTAGGIGSGGDNSGTTGGSALSGATGGRGIGGDDQGGGGGTGLPFGTSGREGTWYASGGISNPGGFGGGSAGGESSQPDTSYGGGGGGFAQDGGRSGLKGDNRGKANGNTMLVPMAGGSGAGAGNRYGGGTAGSGGGGGGAISLVSYEFIEANKISSIGGDGESTTTIKAGGGGGGAGGAIQLSSHSGVTLTQASTRGGIGGTALDQPTEGGLKGGNGSPGRVRLNGKASSMSGIEAGTKSLGPAIFRCVEWDGKDVLVTGAGDPGDSIYLYFWTESTGWSYSSSVSTIVNAGGSWFYAGKLSGTSDAYVAAIQENDYKNDPFAASPDYVMSHTSGIRISPRMLHVSKDTIDFGRQRLCDLKLALDSTLVRATGCDPMEIDEVTLESYPSNAGFSIKVPSDLLLKPDSAGKAISVSFKPIDAGSFSGLIIISRDGQLDTVFVKGIVDEGEKDFSITADTIRSELCDSTITALTIRNNSCRDIILDSLDLQEPLSLIDGQLPLTIPVGETRTVQVRFVPDGSGIADQLAKGHLRFMSQDGPVAIDTTFTLLTQGMPGLPLTITQDTIIDLGKVATCDTAEALIRIPSIGCDSLRVISTTIGTPSNGYSVTGLSPIIPVGSEGELVVQFEPPAVGAFTTTLLIKTNGGTRKVTLIGEGVEGIPLTTTTDTVIDLGTVSLCSSETVLLPIANIGCDSLRIQVPALTGDDEFTLLGLSRSALGKGESSQLTIHFKPSKKGPFSAEMIIVTNGGTRKVTLIGAGTAAMQALELLPGILDFGNVSFCEVKDSVVFLHNAGCDSLIVTSINNAGLSDYQIANVVLPKILPPDSSLRIGVHFQPMLKGQRVGATGIRFTDMMSSMIRDTSFELTANVIDGSKVLSSDISAIDFGESTICEEFDTIITLRNTGCDTLYVSAADAGNKYLVDGLAFPIVIPPGESIDLKLTTKADTTGLPDVLTGLLTITSNSDAEFGAIALSRRLRYPTRLRLEAVDNASGTAGDVVKFRIILDGEVPPTMTALHFDLHHNNDLLEFQGESGPDLTLNNTVGESDQVQSFTLKPVTGAGAIGELTFKTFLTLESETVLSFANIRIEAEGISFAPECLAVISDSGSMFNYRFGCGEQIYQKWMKTDQLIVNAIVPNPATNEITLDLNCDQSGLEVRLFDLLGNEVLKTSGHSKIDVSRLPSGQYVMRLNVAGRSESRGVTIQR